MSDVLLRRCRRLQQYMINAQGTSGDIACLSCGLLVALGCISPRLKASCIDRIPSQDFGNIFSGFAHKPTTNHILLLCLFPLIFLVDSDCCACIYSCEVRVHVLCFIYFWCRRSLCAWYFFGCKGYTIRTAHAYIYTPTPLPPTSPLDALLAAAPAAAATDVTFDPLAGI